MPVLRPPRRAARAASLPLLAVVLSGGCGPDPTRPDAPARAPSTLRGGTPGGGTHRASAGAAPVYMGADANGLAWFLYPAEGTVRAADGSVLELSPALTEYFANVAAEAARVSVRDGAIAAAINARRPPVVTRPCDPANPPPGGCRPADPLRLPLLGAFAVSEPAGPPPTTDAMWVAVLAPPDPIPSNTCRDIAASWGRITARHQGAVDRYKASGAALFMALATAVGTYRPHPPGDDPHFPPPPPLPEKDDIQRILKEGGSWGDVFKFVSERFTKNFGLHVAAAQYDLAAMDMISSNMQKGVQSQLFAAYQCMNRTDWQAPPRPPTPAPPTPPNTDGGPPGRHPREGGPRMVNVCYYWVRWSRGVEVGRDLLYCQMEPA